MKPILSFCLLLFMLAPLSAAVRVNIAANQLNNSSGVAAPQSSLVLLVADTAGNGFSSIQASANLSLNALLNGSDDLIVGRWSLGTSSATNGQFSDATGALNLTSAFAAGKPLALIWLPNLTSSSTTAAGGTTYGIYTGPATDGSATWTVPNDGALVDLNFLTVSGGGTNANTLGNASQTVAQANVVINATPSPPAGGSASGGGTFPAGTNVTLTATANPAYYFKNWQENGTVASASPSYQFTANQSRVLSALFYKRIGADFSNDGKTDIVLQHSGTGSVVSWLMNGTTVTAGPVIAPSLNLSWKVAGSGDFNSDGMSDLVLQHSGTGSVVVWLMNGTTVTSGLTVTSSLNLSWKVAGTGDFNSDGKTDLILQHSGTGSVVAWLMNGAAVTAGPVIAPSLNLSWKVAGSGDFNSDGMSDLILHHSGTGAVIAWLMNGTAVTAGPTITSALNLSWRIAGIGDLNFDGMSDLILHHSSTGAVVEWLMNGTTVTAGLNVTSSLNLNWQVVNH